MEADPNEITYFAKTNFRNHEVPFGIKADDRRRHMYVIGKTGMGKTTLMENMAIQDIRNGHGVCFVDPHGDSIVKILDFIPNDRVNDVIYFNPADMEFPVAFNIMEAVENKFKHLVASGLMGVFTKIWANLWSARMEYILGNTIRALLDSPGNTMLGISRMYVDKQYRKRIVDNIKDPMVKMFWTDEYANYDQKYVKEAIAPIQNKVGQFLSSAIIRNIVGQPKSTIDLREIMDGRKILLMDISKGKVGEENAALLGAMIITKLQLAAMSRVDMPEEERPDFYLYVDEFQNFATESFATILSEARKYHLNLIMGHQYIGQLTPTKDNSRLRDAIFGNVGTMVCFRVGAADAEYLETEFAPLYTPNDLVNLPKYNILLKLMINGISSEPFSAHSIPVNPAFRTNNSEKVIKVSRERYGNNIVQVEERISRWMGAEFHQQSGALASSEDEQLPAPPEARIQDSLPKIEVHTPAKLSSRVEEVITEVEPSPEKLSFAVTQEDTATKVEEQPLVMAKEEQIKDSTPLVFKLPDMPKPQALNVSNNGKFQSGAPRGEAKSKREVFPVARTKDTKFGGKSKLKKGGHQPQRNNIWNTVEALHEEKAVHVAEQLASAFEKSAPILEKPVQVATQTKVVKPGEVHTF